MPVDSTTVATEAELYSRLDALVGEAVENGLTIEGGWTCRSADGQYDYEALITAVNMSNH